MTLTKKNFNNPDSIQNPPFVKIETITIGDMKVEKQTYQPGWRWSIHIKPLAGTNTCQMHHFGILVSGRLGVRTDDGQELEIGPDEVVDIPPGHDGWVIGDRPAIFYSFTSGS